MKAFPMFIRTTGRKVVIVGGGEQAAQKARLLLKTDAKLILVAKTLEDELQGLVDSGRAEQTTELSAELFQDSAMIFVGTGCPGFDAAAHGIAKLTGCPVNVVDQPDLCDMTTPAIVDRDPIVVAIGSEGTAPVLTRDIKTKLERMLPTNLGGLASLAGRLRGSVARQVPRDQRRAFWAWVFKGKAGEQWARGAEREAARDIKAAIAAGGAPKETGQGHISLVGAGPGARDLMTLRAVERLQEADVIFYDRLVDPDVLELARRDAERVFVGKQVGANAWPQDKICALIVAEARKGRNVVRLKSGDPGIFGRATEELDAAKRAGIAIDLVPGVTAAAAAGAALGQSLTERGATDTFVLSTGTGCADNALPDCTRLAAPGTTTAFYMATRQADRIAARLADQGFPAMGQIDVCVDVSKPTERLIKSTLDTLVSDLSEHGVDSGAVILVKWSKSKVTSAGVVPMSSYHNSGSAQAATA
ncbi:siroheme synthase CysG [Shimia ponticola]|uniref:siroheme synthase CysG n=1 Tax=Shimia ponticola TaxID=2582893 RepID=UPI001C9AA2BC|nr:siroheme synthase CysG [Shimia ponticola]